MFYDVVNVWNIYIKLAPTISLFQDGSTCQEDQVTCKIQKVVTYNEVLLHYKYTYLNAWGLSGWDIKGIATKNDN